MFQKQNIPKVEETEIYFLTGSDPSFLVFFLKSTSSRFGRLEAFMACTSVLWGCWKHPIRATQALLVTGSANAKPAAPEAQPLTQSWNTVLGWSNRHLTGTCSLWYWGRQGKWFLVIGPKCYSVTRDTPVTAFLGGLAFGDYEVYWYGLLPVVCLLAAV